MVVTKYDGMIPTTIDGLLTLPGIGQYTAHAIASIAYHQNVPVVDGNVCRVLSRLRGVAQTIKASTFKDKYGWTLAQQLVSGADQTCIGSTTPDACHSCTVEEASNNTATTGSSAAGDINQALMELGATYCAPSGTGIHPDDPLKEFYWSTKLGTALANAIQDNNNNDDFTAAAAAFSSLDSILAHRFSITENDSDIHPHCQLCAKSGMHDAIIQFRNQLEASKLRPPSEDYDDTSNIPVLDNSYQNMVQQLGHGLFPIPPPKVNKKEEVIVIVAICRCGTTPDNESNETKQWLLMKRQDDGGLLSGQWEFPSISVWQSEDEQISKSNGGTGRRLTPRTDMSDHIPFLSVSQRRKHVHNLLKNIGGHVGGNKLQTITDEPIHHIFSHVRHTMYIEYIYVDNDWKFSDDDTTNQAGTIQWMSQTDMDQVGITSGLKKVQQAIVKKLHTYEADTKTKI